MCNCLLLGSRSRAIEEEARELSRSDTQWNCLRARAEGLGCLRTCGAERLNRSMKKADAPNAVEDRLQRHVIDDIKEANDVDVIDGRHDSHLGSDRNCERLVMRRILQLDHL